MNPLQRRGPDQSRSVAMPSPAGLKAPERGRNGTQDAPFWEGHLRSVPPEGERDHRPHRRRRRPRLRLLVLSDVTMALAVLSLLSLSGLGASSSEWLFALVAPGAIASVGAYRELAPVPGAGVRRLGHFFSASAVAAWITWIAGSVTGLGVAETTLALAWLLAPFAWWGGRAVLARATGRGRERVVVIGTGAVAQRAMVLTERSANAVALVGCLDDDPLPLGPGAPPLLGRIDDLPAVLEEHEVDRVLVAFPARRDGDLLPILRECDAHGVHVDVVPRLFEFIGLDAAPSAVGDLPVTSVDAQDMSRGERFAKRMFDAVAAFALLVLISPVLLVVAIAVALDDGFPILYRQDRIGRRGRPFKILKFRTMVRDADKVGLERISALEAGNLSMQEAVHLLKPKDDPRITRVGAFLRKTSLDELPQLWNVVRGEMSLVGPRPLRQFEVDNLDMWQLVRHDVRPGITGLWQVLGRSEMAWDQRMQLDYSYVRHWKLSSDLRILAETVPAVTRSRGAF